MSTEPRARLCIHRVLHTVEGLSYNIQRPFGSQREVLRSKNRDMSMLLQISSRADALEEDVSVVSSSHKMCGEACGESI